MDLWLDFETFSMVNIKLNGGFQYCQDASTNVVCLGYAFDDQPPWIWTPDTPFPEDIIKAIEAGCTVFAHNAVFDMRIWNQILYRDFEGIPLLDTHQVVDTAGLAASFTLPLALKDAGAAMGISMPKDMKGNALIKLLCCPTKAGEQPSSTDPKYIEKFRDFYDYCLRDVEAMREMIQKLPRQHMTDNEARIWRMTTRFNTYGLPIAYDEVRVIKDYLDEYVKVSMTQIPTITKGGVQTVGQIAKLLAWCKNQDYPLANLQVATVEIAIADPNCSAEVKKVLSLRQELGRTSTAKYKKILDLAVKGKNDSYWVHDNLVYHGASPGRWTGRGFQMHNLPRASVDNPEEVIQQFMDHAEIDDPVMKGKALIRSMIKAPDQQMLIVSDYSSIENRVLHWLAGDTKELENFRNGKDQYKTMAAARYRVPYEEVIKSQRLMGKVIILGCIAKGTLVLTRGGPVPIEKIKLYHELWDGDKWITHQGLLDKGMKECLQFADVWMTPDHEIYFGEAKEEAQCHHNSIRSERRAITLAFGKFINSYREQILRKQITGTKWCASSVETDVSMIWKYLRTACLLNVRDAGDEIVMWDVLGKLQSLARGIMADLETYGTEYNLDVMTRKIAIISGMEQGVSDYIAYGVSILKPLFSMLCSYRAAKLQGFDLPESTPTETIGPETLLSIQTYDILNAGDKHRFTLLTPGGPVVASNCGYMMGAETFQKTAQVQFRMDMDEKEAKTAVQAYRTQYPHVVALWKGLKGAAIKTVISGQKNSYGLITFGTATVNGTRWLAMQLPNGKSIYYKNPQVEQKHIPKFETMGRVPTITHEGYNSYSRKWCRLALTPGRITENACQGTAREVMAEGMLNVQDRMNVIDLIGTVHDEALGLIHADDITDTTMHDFDTLLCDIPWAKDCPLTAKGFINNRYKKE